MGFGLPFGDEALKLGKLVSPALFIYGEAENLINIGEGVQALALWVLGSLQWMVENPYKTLGGVAAIAGAVWGGAGLTNELGKIKAHEITEE